MSEPTYEELKARLAALEAQVAKKPGIRKPIELFVTPEGLLQVRNVLKNGTAHNLEPEVPEVLFNNAPAILEFVKKHSDILTFGTDTQEVQVQKEQKRKTLLAAGSLIVRKPREKKQEVAV
jgi:hypothetical protein